MYKSLIRRCKLLILTSVLFILLTGIAMFAYPGGTKLDINAVHYNFCKNFFSDLGATETISGKHNTVSNILFISALGSIGIVLIYFSGIWRAIDTDVHKSKFIGYLSEIFLVICGISFIGIGFTSWNKYFEFHIIFNKLAFGFLLLWTLIIIILQSRNIKIRKLLVINLFYLLLLVFYVFILLFYPKFGAEEGQEFQAVSQKIIFYVTVINFILQAAGIQRFLKTADFRRGGAKNFYL